ncbi:MAG TPA: diguanylate cyclase [Acidimicrobiales bacterium]|nr:diguanylate cyclase [Acidimicrobiales bacterium]
MRSTRAPFRQAGPPVDGDNLDALDVSGAGQAWLTAVRNNLPRGGSLSAGAWERRHRAILVLLWLHVPALAAFGLIRGFALLHVAGEVAVVAVATFVAGSALLSPTVRMAAASFGLASASAILVHFSGGYIEMHFHFFVVVVVVSLYQHWLPFLGTIAYVAVHHGVLGALDPTSVFNHPDAIAHPWKWAGIHAGFILAESAAAVYAWRHSESAQLEAKSVTRNLIAERAQLEERTAALVLLKGVASAANEASELHEAIAGTLRAVCSYTGWVAGHAYLVDDPSGELIDTGIWHREASEQMDAFQRATEEASLVSGLDVGGRVLRRRHSVSIADLATDASFNRKGPAADAALVSSFGLPILAGAEVAGVLEFFADGPDTVDDDLKGLMDQVGTQLGRVVERRRATESVAGAVQALELRNREVTLLSEMGELLQSCEAIDESYGIVTRFAERLFPFDSGAMYLLSASRNVVEAVAAWGEALADEEPVFAPSACWGLRRGRPYETNAASGLACPHVTTGAAHDTICIPMVAQSEAIGILHVRRARGDTSVGTGDARRQLALTVAEHLALAMANYRLRASLRAQSIRDPLTGLYNRRYLEESLDREVRRATRSSKPLSVVSIDIDHFKVFNDTFGHSAGDAVLSAVGRLLLESFRGEDIACRMGGEELVVILPDTSCDAAMQRAEQLRNLVRDLAVDFKGQALGRITISLGISSLPDHARSAEELMLLADAALYQAKAAGRDRTLLHADGPPATP